MQPFAIAGMQLELPAAGDNIARMGQRLDHVMALYPWVQMVMFSELAAFGPLPATATELPGPAEERFQAMAKKHSVWLLPGTMFERVGDEVFNTASVINPEGEVIGRYRKQFPFLPYEEGVSSGDSFLVFDVPDVGRFGVSICYDMWFPETTRTLVSMGAEVILHPTMTTTIDREIELSIARANAAMNQCFFIDVNGAGDSGIGRSILVGPYGDIIHQAGRIEELIPVEIDLDRVRRSREFGLRGLGQPLKSFRDRKVKFELYGPGGEDGSALHRLGPLVVPERGTRAGLRRRPAQAPVEPTSDPALGGPGEVV
ncbi:MAG: carbon-nitrogen hydrolase family protein [Planctomycetota bacterium]